MPQNGSITSWDDGFGSGLVTGADNNVHTVDRADCSASLQNKLSNKTIPNDPPVPVTFNVDGRNHAVNVNG